MSTNLIARLGLSFIKNVPSRDNCPWQVTLSSVPWELTFKKPTEHPPVPPHVNCEADWFYMESSGNCYHIDHTMISSFDAAESKCVGMGGHLASINSPDVQAEIRLHLNDPGAIGKPFIGY